jgi:hypothetical protein
VQQPGVVPLRPLTLGDMFGGALQTVRRNPRATVGLAALVSFAFMIVPSIATLALGAGGAIPSFDFSSGASGDLTGGSGGETGLYVVTGLRALFSVMSSIVVTGLIVGVVEGAVLGRLVGMGDAWQRTRHRLLPLLGLTLLVAAVLALVFLLPIGLGVGIGLAAGNDLLAVVLGVLGLPFGLVASLYLYTRYALLAAPSLVLEGQGVVASLRRGAQLSRGDFWRLLGIYLLTALVTGLVSQVITIPFTIVGVVAGATLPGSWALTGTLLVSDVATVLTGALVGPVSAAVVALQYYDQRFRKEGLDIQLLNKSLQSGRR